MATASSSNPATLQDMVDDQSYIADTLSDRDVDMVTDEPENLPEDVEMEKFDDVATPPQLQDKGKGKLVEMVDTEPGVFRLMDLPTEIRLEIYRACLTRPYKILLSKAEQPKSTPATQAAAKEREQETSSEMETEERGNAIAAYQQLRADRGLPAADLSSRPASTNARRVASSVRHLARNTSRHMRLAPTLLSSTSEASASSNTNDAGSSASNSSQGTDSRLARWGVKPPRHNRASPADPLVIKILRASKEIYKEARSILYSENVFDLSLSTAVPSLAALHQRSRRHIKHVELEIPTYTEILERFSEVVRLSLRYCSGLKKFVIHTPFTLPSADNGNGNVTASSSASNRTVYANGFDILRWLPQQCEVVLKGCENAEIEAVVGKHLKLAKAQDKVSYAGVKAWHVTQLPVYANPPLPSSKYVE
ncbi:hypothetical protein LTR37_019885 [Vermiconidia calcicola]|uniref:Uncharacterized protein n=1 Tax=Vermiconidia calcicola TaxID=1690605 RepID=A0ACC3MEU2_9PEZI|nr:hypothetical protein LTR37_019885 [Vermiconidia calcicola]